MASPSEEEGRGRTGEQNVGVGAKEMIDSIETTRILEVGEGGRADEEPRDERLARSPHGRHSNIARAARLYGPLQRV